MIARLVLDVATDAMRAVKDARAAIELMLSVIARMPVPAKVDPVGPRPWCAVTSRWPRSNRFIMSVASDVSHAVKLAFDVMRLGVVVGNVHDHSANQ